MKDLEKARLKQARESLEDAQALLASDMDAGFVLTNLYYAYYYPILALINEGQVPSTMQSVTIGLFEQRFISTAIFDREYADAIHRVFSSKPKCSGEKTLVSNEEVAELLKRAQGFIDAVEVHIMARGR